MRGCRVFPETARGGSPCSPPRQPLETTSGKVAFRFQPPPATDARAAVEGSVSAPDPEAVARVDLLCSPAVPDLAPGFFWNAQTRVGRVERRPAAGRGRIVVNLHRRQLDASQRAMVAARVRGYHEGEAKKRQREHEGTAPGRKKHSASVDAECLPPRKAGDRGRASTCAGRGGIRAGVVCCRKRRPETPGNPGAKLRCESAGGSL